MRTFKSTKCINKNRIGTNKEQRANYSYTDRTDTHMWLISWQRIGHTATHFTGRYTLTFYELQETTMMMLRATHQQINTDNADTRECGESVVFCLYDLLMNAQMLCLCLVYVCLTLWYECVWRRPTKINRISRSGERERDGREWERNNNKSNKWNSM